MEHICNPGSDLYRLSGRRDPFVDRQAARNQELEEGRAFDSR